MKGHMKKHQFWSGNRKSKRRAWSRALLITSGEKLSGETFSVGQEVKYKC